MIKFIIIFGLLISATTFPQGKYDKLDASKCGYESCPIPKPGMLNVHLVPHTHDDVGWLKTVDQYYFGSKNVIQNAGVQYIIDSVVNELLHDPKKKFIYVETAFFWKWWKEQEDHLKHRVKQLVSNGQLEFIGGAWSMNDEATTHYHSVIDQFTWGFRKLNDTFGSCGRPRIGWQIDPFGHSKETASMMALFGFDGLFFGRLDYQDKDERLFSRTMEMIWEGSSTLGKNGDLLTGVLFNHYSAPKGFCFDVLCDNDPIITDPNSSAFNVDIKLKNFLDFVNLQNNGYLTNNIMLTMGDDFHFQDAHRYYKNLDALIRSPNEAKYYYLKAEFYLSALVLIVNFFLSGSTADIFTGALYNLYQAPIGFCFDIMCGDEPIIDDKHSPDYNVNKKVNKFLEFIERQSKNYKMNDIILTMGGDFNYQDAHYYFKNLEKLIRYVNERQNEGSNVNVFYSTPSCYVKSLNEANVTWPTKEDDFFPYASDPHSYWTGYFTSRPTLKYFERQGNNILQMCKQLSSLAHLGPEDNPDLDALREAMGIMQHHDAITGTEKQHVAHDYARILSEAIEKCDYVASAGLNKIMRKNNSDVPSLNYEYCPLKNISECKISTELHQFIATIYNPSSKSVNYHVRLPVSGRAYSVKDANGLDIINQIVPIPSSLINLPGRISTSSLELVFEATAVPPLGYRSYYISVIPSNDAEQESELVESLKENFIGNEKLGATINDTTGLLSSIKIEDRVIHLTQNLEYYIGYTGNNNEFENRSSGAYIFRPKTQESQNITDEVQYSVFKGPVVHEVHQIFSSWASQIIRQYVNHSLFEIEWLIGPIPVDDGSGKEIISKYKSNINSDDIFYTDSNGRQTIRRQRNFRPTWDLRLHEPVAGNYYPVTTDISIRDSNLDLAILVDRAEGGSSLKNGEIELMLHRRLLHDDAFGVNEALNEIAFEKGLVARGTHWILLGNASNPDWEKEKRLLVQEKILNPQIILSDATSLDFDYLKKTYKLEYSGLTENLPSAIQILTLEPWKGKTYLLRLEHLFESHPPVELDLSKIFSSFEIINARETSLGADRWLDEVSRFKWRKETNEIFDETDPISSYEFNFPFVKILPKQIRTFICKIQPKSLT